MSLNRRDTVMLRTGLPGSGKSWSLAKYVVDEWIPNHSGVVFTNVPINVDAVANYFAKRGKVHESTAIYDRVSSRIVRIPENIEQGWLEGEGDPGSYFGGVWREMLAENEIFPVDLEKLTEEEKEAITDAGLEHPLSRALVVIDEAGKMWPAEPDKERKAANNRVKLWIATLRHYGARVCFVLQDEMQLDAGIRRLRAVEILTTKMNTQPEALTGALVDHWAQLWAKVFGRYPVWMREEEFVKEGKNLVSVRVYSGLMSPKYFAFYDSHNNPGEISGQEEEPEFKRFGWVRFLIWLIAQNSFNWGWRLVVAAFAYLLVGPPFMYGPKVITSAIRIASEWDPSKTVLGIAGVENGAGEGGTKTPGAENSDLKNVENAAKTNTKTPGLLSAEPVWLVGLVGPWALLSDGSEIKEGQEYEGKKLVKTDSLARMCVWSDGSKWRLQARSAVRPSSFAGTVPTTASVAGTIPTAGNLGGTPGGKLGTIKTGLPGAQGGTPGNSDASIGLGVQRVDGRP